MKTILSLTLLVIVAAVAWAVAPGKLHLNFSTGNGSPSQQETGGGGTPAPVGKTPIRTPAPDPVTDSKGTPVVTFRGTSGSDRVSCSAIDTEFKLEAYGGRMRWTAQAPAGITADPSSGALDRDESTVIHVSGTSAGPFSVVVQAPNRAGSGSTSVQFTCRGQ